MNSNSQAAPSGPPSKRILLVGNPNVGKSALFGRLTGRYAVVSNFPGTTVEISAGRLRLGGSDYEVVDTPGIGSLSPIGEEERVTRELLVDGRPDLVVAVGDARNLRRVLRLALEVRALGAPTILVLNMIDEAEERGFEIDSALLAAQLGVPVVQTAAVYGHGIGRLLEEIVRARVPDPFPPVEEAEAFVQGLAAMCVRRRTRRALGAGTRVDRALLAVAACGLALLGWVEIGGLLGYRTPADSVVEGIARAGGGASAGLLAGLARLALVAAPVLLPVWLLMRRSRDFASALGVAARRPASGIPLLVAVMFLVYELVGRFGARTAVDFVEKDLFGRWVVPAVARISPAGFWSDLLVGPYGVVSMGLAYAVGIVLPITATFFLALGALEDSGYLPRLSILADRALRAVGLNGRAVLPLVLGLGCCTMATMTTRILGSRKERMLATLLLALGIPCSAQLGVILGIASGYSPLALVTVFGVVAAELLIVGFLASKLIGGRRSQFVLEIPPMRAPIGRNLWLKTSHRIRWYLREAVPLFLYGTVALFLLDRIRVAEHSLLAWVERGMEPVLTGMLRLPGEVAGIFLLGFLRRDYGAAGLFAMVQDGRLTPVDAVVSLIVLTLFIPCLASFLMIAKEQGMRGAVAITGFILPFAIGTGAAVSWVLRTFHITF